MEFWDEVRLELIKTGLTCFTLGLGWIVGQRIIAFWEIRKKRQELDVATVMEFHKLYGEFKEVSRLWRTFTFAGKRKTPLVFADSTQMDLLKRATASEGSIEAIIVKLSIERDLTEADINTLGLFRQAYQRLRESIRDGVSLDWTYGTPDYILYNDLATRTSHLISSGRPKSFKQAEVHRNLREITAVRPDAWQSELCRIFNGDPGMQKK